MPGSMYQYIGFLFVLSEQGCRGDQEENEGKDFFHASVFWTLVEFKKNLNGLGKVLGWGIETVHLAEWSYCIQQIKFPSVSKYLAIKPT